MLDAERKIIIKENRKLWKRSMFEIYHRIGIKQIMKSKKIG